MAGNRFLQNIYRLSSNTPFIMFIIGSVEHSMLTVHQNSNLRIIYTISILQKLRIMQSRRGWSQIEDDRLLKIIKKYGTKNWSLIAQKLSIGTTFQRTGKQCRQRWYNHLNPQINSNNWTIEEDETLFEAHRRHGSKWKQISKLLAGRTDNSIKNHFYSTVRKSLRTISKMRGQKNTTITMKSIKPYVLSKIVQNTQLTNLIVMLGRSKLKESINLNIKQSVVEQISQQLKRISLQYQQKNKQVLELSKLGAQSKSNNSLNSLPASKEDQQQQVPHISSQQKRQFKPDDYPMKQYFQEFQSNHNQRSEYILQTANQSKQRNQIHIKELFSTNAAQHSVQFKYQTSSKCPQKELNQQSCIFEECQSNFFVSPSCGKRKEFPDLRLLAKISRNSYPSPGCSSKHEERIYTTMTKSGQLKQQNIEIHFDPRQFLNEQFPEKQHNENQ